MRNVPCPVCEKSATGSVFATQPNKQIGWFRKRNLVWHQCPSCDTIYCAHFIPYTNMLEDVRYVRS